MNRSALNFRRKERYSQSVIQHYLQSPLRSLPALAYEICIYLAECYACGNVRLLDSKVLAIGRWHTENGFPDPTESRSVIHLTKAIKTAASEKASKVLQAPPTITDVKRITDALLLRLTPSDSTSSTPTSTQKVACRNRAIWLIGFWFGLTTSEVCRLRKRDVHLDQTSLSISKKWLDDDQLKLSFRLPRLPILCPVSALEAWLRISDNSVEYLFPSTCGRSVGGAISSRSVHADVRKMMASIPDLSVNTGVQHYSLYFFLTANGWTRSKILEMLPIYKAAPSKIRTLKTKQRLDADNTPPWLSGKDMLDIHRAYMNIKAHPCF